MSFGNQTGIKQIITVVSIVVLITSLITIFFTYNQVTREEDRLEKDIYNRSSLVADGLKDSIEPHMANPSKPYFQGFITNHTDSQRIAGIVIIDSKDKILAASKNLPTNSRNFKKIGTDVMDGDKPHGQLITYNGEKLYVFAYPLHNKKNVIGSVMIVQHAGYIDTRIAEIWQNNVLRLIIQALLISLALLLIFKWIIFEPIRKLAKSLKSTRLGDNNTNASRILNNSIFGPLLSEVGNIQKNLVEARLAANEEAQLRLKKLDATWTAERLSAFVQNILKKRSIYVVSNREPYIHTKNGNQIEYFVPASGMVTAIEPIMQATGGMWVAQASGDADKLVVDKDDKVNVPPNDPKYSLKRIWLTEKEQKGFYDGFSNEGIWPLCHLAHTRPTFRKDDWDEYKKVNEKFAKAILKEIRYQKNPVILIQDFHFSLLPRLIKDKRPDATIGLFWHIPWPNAESFSICPWKKEILYGMLGADILGFHTQQHCNNFINSVGKELEALRDLEQFSITKNGHKTFIKPFPISIAFTDAMNKIEGKKASKSALAKIGIKTKYIGIGVDRLDYTKGLLERLKGIELFLTNYPSYIEKFTFLQISAPSRSTIKQYQEFEQNVEKEIERINNLFKRNNWRPIVFLKKYHSHEDIYPLYRAADFCLVTSLHDGMNLVAKEFVSARDDEKGVLILSQFTGAARELEDALIINPYNGEQTADAINTALKMKKSEQGKRMRRMRNIVKGYNIYRWSAELLKTIVDLG
jgi:trehalose-6-phosphate synthase